MTMMNEILNLVAPNIILLSSVLIVVGNLFIGMKLRRAVEKFNIASEDLLKFISSFREFEERLNRVEKVISSLKASRQR